MRNLKKLLAVVVTLVMLVVFTIPAFAADTTPTYGAEAQKLNDMGLYAGISTTSFNPDLGSALDRETGIAMLLRIFGLEAAAKALTAAEVDAALAGYTDAKDLQAWAKNQMAYAVINGITVGTSATTLSPKANLSAEMYCAFIIRQLGFADNYKTVVAQLQEKGGLTADQATALKGKALTKDDLVGISFGSLKAINSDGKTVIQALVAGNVVTEAAAVTAGVYTAPAPAAAVMTGVSATNLKEILVAFDKAPDAAAAVLSTNYTVSVAVSAYELLSDGKTVKLTLTNPAGQQSTVDVTYGGVTKTATMFDATIPTVTGYTFTGPQTIEVAYSEPVGTAGVALVDNGVYGAATALSATKDNVVVVTLGTTIPAGAHTLKMSGSRDYAYAIADTVLNITYAADVTAPTVSVAAGATQTSVTLNFSKDVKGMALANFYHTYSPYTPTSAKDSAGNPIVATSFYSSVVLDFTDRPLPAGTTNVIVLKTVGAVTVTDRWGNVLATDAILPVTTTADVTAPIVTKVEATAETTVVVTYSEAVSEALAETKANYVFKKADGTVVTPAAGAIVYDATAHTATITFAAMAGGAYTVAISGVKDTSVAQNLIVPVTLPFVVSDKTAINSTTNKPSAIKVETVAAGADFVYITYPELMSTSGAGSIIDLTNYKIGTSALDAVALADGSSVAIFGTNDKVKLTIAGGVGNADLTGKKIYVRNLADAAGNVMTAFAIEIDPAADAAPVVTAVKTTALNKLDLTLSKQLSAITAADFVVGTADAGPALPVAYATYVNNSDGTSTVSVILDANEVLPDEGALPTSLAIVGANTKSLTGAAIVVDADLLTDAGAYAEEVVATLADGVAPAVASVVFVNATTIKVNFTEDLLANSIALAGNNGFTVNGGTLTSAVRGATSKEIVLTGTDFTVDTDVMYTPGNITDASAARNALGAISQTDALAAP